MKALLKHQITAKQIQSKIPIAEIELVTLQPGCVQKLMKTEALRGVHLKAAVQELQQLVAHIRVRERELATDYVRLGSERVAPKDGEIKGDTDGPDGGRLRLVKSREDPLGRHALQSALELLEHLALDFEVGGRAEIDQLDGVVLQVDQNVLGLDVPVDDALGVQWQVDLDQLREDLLQDVLAEGEGLAVGQVEQGDAAAQLLHDDHEAGALLKEVVDLDDARGVAQPQQTLDLEGQVAGAVGAAAAVVRDG